jgi:drug/metabolite transporter (DMT)-like permease
LRRHQTLLVSFAAMLASVLALMLLALPENWPRLVGHLSLTAWSMVGFLGLFSALGYGWWLYALKHLAPTQVTVFLSLSPLTAALLGWPVLDEAPGFGVLGAILLIGAGLWLATGPGPDRAARSR